MNDEKSRAPDELRSVEFILHFTKWAEGSVLTKFGDTHVLCNATLESELPRWLQEQDKPHGWVTGEYSMLPRSTHSRRRSRLFPGGRVQEISRLIGRSLRLAVDLEALGERQVVVDCTVLQADGGTRTAAVTGGWLAIALALRPLIESSQLPSEVLKHQIAAISVGIVQRAPVLDLAYKQDSMAEVDCNIVMTATGGLVEIQGTAEKAIFSRPELDQMLELARQGIQKLVHLQNQALANG